MPRSDALTKSLATKVSITELREFITVCETMDISKAEGLRLAVAMWVEFMKGTR